MYKLFIYISLFLFCSLFAFSCNKKKGKIRAQVYNEVLYDSDIQDIIPENTAPEDSISMANFYIEQWIKDAIILHDAKKSIKKDFEKRLRDYKNSLIIYEYEALVVDQKIDTNISAKEIQEYYNAYPDNFILKENILKVLYVKLRIGEKETDKIKKILFKQNLEQKDLNDIQHLIEDKAVNHFLDNNKWLTFQELQREIPIETYNEKLFLQNNKNVTIQDKDYVYLARILDFKIKESASPLNFEKEKIREILINKRKVEIIENMLLQLMKEAEINNEIKIY